MLALKQPRMLMNWRDAVRRLSTTCLPERTHDSTSFAVDGRHASKPALRPHERSPLTPTSFLPSLR